MPPHMLGSPVEAAQASNSTFPLGPRQALSDPTAWSEGEEARAQSYSAQGPSDQHREVKAQTSSCP